MQTLGRRQAWCVQVRHDRSGASEASVLVCARIRTDVSLTLFLLGDGVQLRSY